MKKYFLAMAVIAGGIMGLQPLHAQQVATAGVQGEYGMTQPVCVDGRARPLGLAHRDPYSPHPHYAYSRRGVNASWENSWNQNRAQVTPWHGGYSYWRWGTPTALVVPPTAAFQTSYGWGVGQTQSMPINHQFNKATGGRRNDAGFRPTPYWPSHTGQFGVYPVRAPWN